MSGNYEFAMVSMLQAAVDMPGYFAERAYRAMKVRVLSARTILFGPCLVCALSFLWFAYFSLFCLC